MNTLGSELIKELIDRQEMLKRKIDNDKDYYSRERDIGEICGIGYAICVIGKWKK